MPKFTVARWLLVGLFAGINSVFLYLFLLQLPYGIEPLRVSLHFWGELSPRIEVVTAVALGTAALGMALVRWLSGPSKNRILYLRRGNAHPGTEAFFRGREPGFDRAPLLAAYPAVKDSAFAPDVQHETWQKIYRKHAALPVVLGPARTWEVLRDLYLMSAVYLGVFLLTWPLNVGVKYDVSAPYLFVYGAQALFLMFSARRMGWRMVHNVLAIELGIRPGESMDVKKKKKSGRSRK